MAEYEILLWRGKQRALKLHDCFSMQNPFDRIIHYFREEHLRELFMYRTAYHSA
jgi:hypothetical protein